MAKKKPSVLVRLSGVALMAAAALVAIFIVPNINITLPPNSPIPEGINTIARLAIALASAGFFVAGLMSLATGDYTYIKEYFENK